MRRFGVLLVFALLLLVPTASQAENPRWFEIKSDNFLVLTDTSEAKGRRLAADFELRVATFQKVFGNIPKRQFPVEILMFKKGEDFNAAVPVGTVVDVFTNAVFLKGPDRFFILAQDRSPDEIAGDVGHALGHVFLNRLIYWRPFWLAEAAGEYFRKIGKGPENKKILPEHRITVADLLKIVPSATFKDSDPAGPFRIQSYRFFRILLDQNPAEFKSYFKELQTIEGRNASPKIDAAQLTEQLNQFTDTKIALAVGSPAVQAGEIPEDSVSLHRGDAAIAAHQLIQARMWYEGDSNPAKAARAILGFIQSGSDATPMMQRAVQDLPDQGLLQYYFGSIDSKEEQVVNLQIEALRRAVQQLPLMAAADIELARVLTVAGKFDEAMPLLDRALPLEPELADRVYVGKAEVLLLSGKGDEGNAAAKLAAALPHADSSVAGMYSQQIAALNRRIQEIADAAERRNVNDLRASVEAEATRREPPRPPPPPPPPIHAGQMNYEFEASNPVQIEKSTFPNYPDSLVNSGKTGNITFQVSIGKDGHVTNAVITNSQLPEMDDATLAAIRTWTFKPFIRGGQATSFTMKLVMKFSLL
jgi:TonB family protein